MSFPTKTIIEGKAKLIVPEGYSKPEDAPVFFNPEMRLNRDVTVSVAKAHGKLQKACDLLAGTGAKGIRMKLEANIDELILNDANPRAVELIEENLKLNGVEAEVSQKTANLLLSENRAAFDFIDVDPFGSPSQFMDSASRALVPRNSILAVTATDTSALCGTYPNACMRKYGIRVRKTKFYNELGLRVLIAFCVREASKHEIGLHPVFSHSTRHYTRAFLESERGRTAANKAMKSLDFLGYCYKCGKREYGLLECCDRKTEVMGPIWSKGIAEKSFVKKMEPVSPESEKLIALLGEEADLRTPYYDLHDLAGKHGFGLMPMDEALEKTGGVRTHFRSWGLKFDGEFRELLSALRE
jgi:tRNA (guanine26-N2/guanine27-N2)-dimethyltransferase